MKKKGVLIILILAFLIGIVAYLVILNMNQNESNINESNINTNENYESNTDNTYKFLLASEIDNTTRDINGKTQRDIVIEKLESSEAKGIEHKGQLQLLNPEYIYYCAFGSYTRNFYSMHVNENHFLFPANIRCGADRMGFYIVDSNLEIHPMLLEYSRGENTALSSGNYITKGDWNFIYNEEYGTLNGYFDLEVGYLEITITNNEIQLSDFTINDLAEKIANALKFSKEDIHMIDPMADGIYTEGFVLLSDDYSAIDLGEGNILDLTSNVYVTHWYVANNWSRNDVELITKDFKSKITVRESLGEYNLEEIANSSDNMEIEEYNYNGQQLQLIYYRCDEGSFIEEYDGAFLGFVTEINNKSYAFMFELEEDIENQLFKGTDPKEKIDNTYSLLLK